RFVLIELVAVTQLVLTLSVSGRSEVLSDDVAGLLSIPPQFSAEIHNCLTASSFEASCCLVVYVQLRSRVALHRFADALLLPAAGLADETHRLARVHAEAERRDDRHLAATRGVGDADVPELEQRGVSHGVRAPGARRRAG